MLQAPSKTNQATAWLVLHYNSTPILQQKWVSVLWDTLYFIRMHNFCLHQICHNQLSWSFKPRKNCMLWTNWGPITIEKFLSIACPSSILLHTFWIKVNSQFTEHVFSEETYFLQQLLLHKASHTRCGCVETQRGPRIEEIVRIWGSSSTGIWIRPHWRRVFDQGTAGQFL